MAGTREFLRSIGLPSGDLGGLPDSAKRFPDGAYPAGSHLEATTVALSPRAPGAVRARHPGALVVP